jgi:integrase/recombinase XerD
MKRTKQPPAETKKKRYQFKEEKVMSRSERSQLLRYVSEKAELDLIHGRKTWPPRKMLVYLALYSGLRVSEITALKIGDLNLKSADPYILVRKAKRDKTRKVYIPQPLVKMLKEYIQYKKQTLGEQTQDDSPLFANKAGDHFAVISLMKSFKESIIQSGLRNTLSIHCARHTYATFLLDETGNLAHVKKQLGHENIAMTSIYADVLPDMNTRLVNQMSFE